VREALILDQEYILLIKNGERMLSIGQKFPEFKKLACISI
jgi:hypothetical protein